MGSRPGQRDCPVTVLSRPRGRARDRAGYRLDSTREDAFTHQVHPPEPLPDTLMSERLLYMLVTAYGPAAGRPGTQAVKLGPAAQRRSARRRPRPRPARAGRAVHAPGDSRPP